MGFIGFHTDKRLLIEKYDVIGIDNMDDTYDIRLKEYRLSLLKCFPNFYFYKLDIINFEILKNIFDQNQIIKIIHLAARTGVRKSLKEPQEYINSNIIGTVNLLELSKYFQINNFISASTYSVYLDNKIPFKEDDNKINQIKSIYGITNLKLRLFDDIFSE